MNSTYVPVLVAIISVMGTIGVAIIQARQKKEVTANTDKLSSQESLFAIVLADLEIKDKRLKRFEEFFQSIGLATPNMLRDRMDKLERELERHRKGHGASDNK